MKKRIYVYASVIIMLIISSIQSFGSMAYNDSKKNESTIYSSSETGVEINIHKPTEGYEYSFYPPEVYEAPRFNITVNFNGTPDSSSMIFNGSAFKIEINETLQVQNLLSEDLNDTAASDYQDVWNDLDEGEYTMEFYANNTDGNETTSAVNIYKKILEEDPSDPEPATFLDRLYSLLIVPLIWLYQLIIGGFLTLVGLAIYKKRKEKSQNKSCPCIGEKDCWCEN